MADSNSRKSAQNLPMFAMNQMHVTHQLRGPTMRIKQSVRSRLGLLSSLCQELTIKEPFHWSNVGAMSPFHQCSDCEAPHHKLLSNFCC
mmetsp:Transcript_68286/g.114774  ORF Transcript_68286/g.114774 Transcript_68286/m.114774 type:complete len:89 (+) Transcript_68286:2-268(+)